MTATIPTTTAALTADSLNPRAISDPARLGLSYSLTEYGDLSGIVFNSRTQQLVGAHQRLDRIRATVGELQIVPDTTTPDAAGDLWGHIIFEGHRFPVRIVDWPMRKQRAANVAANSPTIAGQFNEAFDTFLLAIRDETPDAFDGLLLHTLIDEPPAPEEEKEKPQQARTVVRSGDVWSISGQHGHLVAVAKMSGALDPKVLAKLLTKAREMGLVIRKEDHIPKSRKKPAKSAKCD
jgi:hypothetical protein